MNCSTMLRLISIAAAALAVLAPSAFANPLTSPAGTAYTSTIKAVSERPIWLAGAFNTVECRKSTLEGKVEAHSSSSASGKVSSLTFSECNYPVVVKAAGSLEVKVSEGGTASVISTGASIEIETSTAYCVFTTNNTTIGTLTNSKVIGGNATLDMSSAQIPRTSGHFNCGSVGTLDGSYEVTTPGTLNAGHSAGSASSLTSPEGTPYTDTIKAESEGTISLDGKFGTVSCKSSLEGKVESHTEATAGGKLTSLTFTECNEPVAVKATGSFNIHDLGTGEAAFTSTGAEISISTLGGTCVFTASETDLGVLAGSDVTGGNATLNVDFAAIPRTGGNSECGPNVILTGSYKVTTPSTLYVGHTINPLTSPEGTPYASTLKAESEGAISFDGAFVTVSCLKSALEADLESYSSTGAVGSIGSFTFSECNYPVTVVSRGGLEVHATGSALGTVKSSGAVVELSTSVGVCAFSTFTTDIGTLTDSSITGGNATLDIGSASIPKTGGNFLCGSSGTWTGSYKVTTPSTLYVSHSPSPLTSPEGTRYTSTIKAETSNFELDGAFVTIKCSSSSFEGKVESHTETTASGKLSGFNFSGCNYATTVLKPGSLQIHTSGGAATVTSTGAEISIATSSGTCVFTTSSTDIGTITDTAATKGHAVLDINSAKIPKTGGNFLCGASGTWTGSYTFTTPSTLYVD